MKLKVMETPSRASTLRSVALRATTWLLAAGCFYLVYRKIDAAAAGRGLTAWQFLVDFFAAADWLLWLAIMVPYSVFFFLVDAHVTWRVVRWFNAPQLRYVDVLPIRASAYILSLVNEQVGKGAMTLYLRSRHAVPGWEALSSMILLGLLEIYQLLIFASIGMAVRFDLVTQASTVLPLDRILPAVAVGAALYAPVHVLYFRGTLLPGLRWRDLPVLAAFRRAQVRHYVLALLAKAPNLIGGVIVYTTALSLFNVDVSMAQMFTFLPVIFLAAAVPLPFHAGALLLWSVLFPDYPEVAAFSLVMHTFFVLFNALIGVAFLPRANRELFGVEAISERTAAKPSP